MDSLTSTQYDTLKHVLKLDNRTIEQFARLDLDENTKNFIIFDMMVRSYQNVQKRQGRG